MRPAHSGSSSTPYLEPVPRIALASLSQEKVRPDFQLKLKNSFKYRNDSYTTVLPPISELVSPFSRSSFPPTPPVLDSLSHNYSHNNHRSSSAASLSCPSSASSSHSSSSSPAGSYSNTLSPVTFPATLSVVDYNPSVTSQVSSRQSLLRPQQTLLQSQTLHQPQTLHQSVIFPPTYSLNAPQQLYSSSANKTPYLGYPINNTACMNPGVYQPSPYLLESYTDHHHQQHGVVKKQAKRRTRTGCLTCRRRRIKCDERKPGCKNCEKSKVHCLGYQNKPTKNELKKMQKLKEQQELSASGAAAAEATNFSSTGEHNVCCAST